MLSCSICLAMVYYDIRSFIARNAVLSRRRERERDTSFNRRLSLLFSSDKRDHFLACLGIVTTFFSPAEYMFLRTKTHGWMNWTGWDEQ